MVWELAKISDVHISEGCNKYVSVGCIYFSGTSKSDDILLCLLKMGSQASTEPEE